MTQSTRLSLKACGLSSLKIAFVFHRSDIVGGVSVYALALARELRRQGHSMCFFVPRAGHFTDLLDAEEIAWKSVPFLSRSLNPIKNFSALVSLYRKLKSYAPNLISAQASVAGMLCRAISLRLDIPVVYTPHSWIFAPGTPTIESKVGWIIEKGLRHCTQSVIAVSKFERDLGIERGVVNSDQIVAIHNGIPDTQRVAQMVADSSPMRIVSVARFERQKDQESLLRAIAGLPHGRVELVLVGDGSLMGEAQTLADELGIADLITWKGAIDEVEAELLDADLFALSTRWESLPICIIEAMRAGLPVIASDVGGVNELVMEGKTGLLVKPGSPDDLRNVILRLVDDEQMLRAMGKAGRARFEQYFTLDKMIDPTIELYQQLASTDKVPVATVISQ
jgi:glycosyltransferase involved in cell wall biosynthesis